MTSVHAPEDRLKPVNVPVTIHGRHVTLQPISENEINERYLSWLNDPEVNQFLETRYVTPSKETIRDYINGLRSKPGCELFGIFTKKEKIHVGNLSISQYNPSNQGLASYGQMIGEGRARALGVGGEVSALIVEFLFRDPQIHRVWGAALASNVNAWRTSEFLEFRREGTLRNHAVLSDGTRCDVYQYGILREEWPDAREKVAGILKSMQIVDHLPSNELDS